MQHIVILLALTQLVRAAHFRYLWSKDNNLRPCQQSVTFQNTSLAIGFFSGSCQSIRGYPDNNFTQAIIGCNAGVGEISDLNLETYGEDYFDNMSIAACSYDVLIGHLDPIVGFAPNTTMNNPPSKETSRLLELYTNCFKLQPSVIKNCENQKYWAQTGEYIRLSELIFIAIGMIATVVYCVRQCRCKTDNPVNERLISQTDNGGSYGAISRANP